MAKTKKNDFFNDDVDEIDLNLMSMAESVLDQPPEDEFNNIPEDEKEKMRDTIILTDEDVDNFLSEVEKIA